MKLWACTLALASLVLPAAIGSTDCGRVLVNRGIPLILGSASKESYPGRWPWLAPLFKRADYQCGSSLVSDRHVLTAAHCVVDTPPSDWHALLGRFSLSNDAETHFVRRNVIQSFVHEDYSGTTELEMSRGDIALLRLESKVEYSDYIQPVCLPQPYSSPDGKIGSAAGYGYYASQQYVDKPRCTSLKAINSFQCLFNDVNYKKIVSERSFCAKHLEGQAAPCTGDSGSGFYFADESGDRSYAVYGIVSHSLSSLCHPTDYTVFTDVTKYLDWIREKMQDECDASSLCPGDLACFDGRCIDPCSKLLCGPFARCSNSAGNAFCECTSYGDHPDCRQDECVTNSHCNNIQVCSNGMCVDPCDLSPCGTNAVCSRTHAGTRSCSCKSGFEGDAYRGCSRRTKTTTTTERPVLIDEPFFRIKEDTTTPSTTSSYCYTEFCKANGAKCNARNTVCTCEVRKQMDCFCSCDSVEVVYENGGSTTTKKNFQWFLEW